MALRCGHCGREDTREMKETVVLSERHDTVPIGGGYQQEISTQKIVQVDLCTGCGKPSLSSYTWVDEYMDPAEVVPDELYPERRNLDDLPDRIRNRYVAMLELQHAPDAFAGRAGRLLESICADQGVPRTDEMRDLYDRLNAMVERGDVPQPLIDQAHLVREYRNIGAHDAELEVEDEDVPPIRRFVEALLDFLYWGPASLARVTGELEQRKKAAADSKST